MSSHSHTSTTQDQATHLTQTPTNPAWVDSGLGQIGSQIGDLSKLDPYSLVAGPNALQTQAGTSASGLTSSPGYNEAAGIYGATAGAGANTYNPAQATSASLLDGLQGYMNPYTNDVVNTTLKGFDQNSNQVRSQQMLDLANDTTFGGSGGSILRAQTEGQLGLGRAQTEAQLRDQAFNTGATLSNEDAGRRQQTSLANMDALNQGGQFNATAADLALQRQQAAAAGLSANATAQGADQRSNIGLQGDLGAQLQALDQQRAIAPLSLLGTQAALFSGLPLNLLHGDMTDGTQHTTGDTNTTSTNPLGIAGSLLNAGGSLATGLGSMGIGFGAHPSDRRLKRDVVKVGERPDGLGVYLFRYLWGSMLHLGVMAQEVLKVKPEAVVTMPNGYMAVDYGAL